VSSGIVPGANSARARLAACESLWQKSRAYATGYLHDRLRLERAAGGNVVGPLSSSRYGHRSDGRVASHNDHNSSPDVEGNCVSKRAKAA
jgi:hypothetical protein